MWIILFLRTFLTPVSSSLLSCHKDENAELQIHKE